MITSKALNTTNAVRSDLTLNNLSSEPRVDSRLLAIHLSNQHRQVMVLIDRYAEPFATFGKVLFKKHLRQSVSQGNENALHCLTKIRLFFF